MDLIGTRIATILFGIRRQNSWSLEIGKRVADTRVVLYFTPCSSNAWLCQDDAVVVIRLWRLCEKGKRFRPERGSDGKN